MTGAMALSSSTLVARKHFVGPQFAAHPVRSSRASSFRRITTTATQGGGRFDEGADQVRRLLGRDRTEVKDYGDIGGALKAEFDEGEDEPQQQPGNSSSNSSSAPSSSGATTAAAAAAAPKPASPFGKPSGGAASPFGASRKPIFEPEGLRPDLPADPIDETPWWKKEITLTQIVIALSFTLIIGLMLATFAVVLKSGGISFNDA